METPEIKSLVDDIIAEAQKSALAHNHENRDALNYIIGSLTYRLEEAFSYCPENYLNHIRKLITQ